MVPEIPLSMKVEVEGGRAVREINPATTRTFVIELSTGSLAGVVVDAEGVPLVGLELTAHPPGATDHSPVRLVTTEGNGRFRLDTLLEGDWRMVAREGRGFLLKEDVRVEGGAIRDVTLQVRRRPR